MVDNKAVLTERKDDDAGTTIANGGLAESLTPGSWYTMKAVIDDDLGNSALQRLRFYVDANANGSFDESTEKFLDTTVIDDDWSAGYVGLFRQNTVSAATLFDSFKAGIDNNADGDIDDGGDEVIIDDDFNSTSVSLAYDSSGNCTDDGIYKYVYDGWNRPAKAKHRSVANATTVATYAYDGVNRRISETIANTGVENELGDGGVRTSHFYYAGGMGVSPVNKVIEERNGSSEVVRAYAWGSQGGDLLWVEINGDPTLDDDSNPDNTTGGESGESPADMRYFAHADRSGGIAALTQYDTGGTDNGLVVERHATIGGRRVLLSGDAGSGELTAQSFVSTEGRGGRTSDNLGYGGGEGWPTDSPQTPEPPPSRPTPWYPPPTDEEICRYQCKYGRGKGGFGGFGFCNGHGQLILCNCKPWGPTVGYPEYGSDYCEHPTSPGDCVLCHESVHPMLNSATDCSDCLNPNGCIPHLGETSPGQGWEAYHEECVALAEEGRCLARVQCDTPECVQAWYEALANWRNLWEFFDCDHLYWPENEWAHCGAR